MSFINVSGLAIGIGAALVIYLIVQYELSYEKFQDNLSRRYRVVTNMHFPDADFKNGGVPGPLPEALKAEIPTIEKSTFILQGSSRNVSVKAASGEWKQFRRQPDILLANSDYFDFLHYQWLAGQPSESLNEPGEVVLTDIRARTYFPGADFKDVLGRSIVYDDSTTARVTGVVKDLEAVTEFNFKEFISLSTYIEVLKKENGMNEWGSVSSSWQFFVQLQNGADPKKVDRQIKAVKSRHAKEAYLEMDHFLQPMRDIHFDPDFDSITQPRASRKMLYGLIAVAVFLLALGCINFINLTTAQSSQRAKEIGIRKTLGSSKPQVIRQFLSETFLLTLIATFLSLALTPLILKVFSEFIPGGLHFSVLANPAVIIFLFGLIVVVSVLSGFYPAIVLSRFRPVTVLKNVAYSGSGATRTGMLRKVLTISQFVIAQFLIIATVIVAKQIHFALTKDMGFRKEAIVNFNLPRGNSDNEKKQVLFNEIKSLSGIETVSLAGTPPAANGRASSTMKFVNDGKNIETTVDIKYADENYFELYKMKLLAGRNFLPADTARECVINASYAHFLGYKDPRDLVGKVLENGSDRIPIVGVLKDFNPYSIASSVKPLIYYYAAKDRSTFHVAFPLRQSPKEYQATLGLIEKRYKELYPGENFDYSYVDDSIAKFYQKEQDISRLLQWSTGLAIFISCLGLFGLVMFTTSQRVKEIGIRKVLGATVAELVRLLSKDLLFLVIVAFVIAAPLGWLAGYKWLENYAYKTAISWWIFVACISGMLAVAFITLSFKTIQAALSNPVDSLRNE